MRTFIKPLTNKRIGVTDCDFTNSLNEYMQKEVFECTEYTRLDDAASISVRSFENKLERDIKCITNNRMTTLFTKEPWTVQWLEETIKPEHVFWDIGACHGVYTVYTSMLGCKSIRAFEPIPENLLSMQRNLKVNKIHNAKLHNMAITDECGFFDWSYTNRPGSGASHLDKKSKSHKHIIELSHTIQTSTMDSLVFEHGFEQPDIIKIDTDGTDPQCIVDGGLKVLENVTSILIEIFDDPWDLEFHHQLLDLGFELDMGFYDGIREARLERTHHLLQKCVELIYFKK